MDCRTYKSLLALPDDTLVMLERQPHCPPPPTLGAPVALCSLHHLAEPLIAAFPYLPMLNENSFSQSMSGRRSRPRLRLSKRVQIASVTSLIQAVLKKTSMSVARVADLGAGHGHLSAHLATYLTPTIPIVAIDRDEELLKKARGLHRSLGTLTFDQRDAVLETQSSHFIRDSDFVVGLHACGMLGDAVISHTINANAAAVLLVSCCLQKHQHNLPVRCPLSYSARSSCLNSLLTIPQATLGATNASHGYKRKSDLSARETRHAVRLLLRKSGIIHIGNEMKGISRHAFKNGLEAVTESIAVERGMQEGVFSKTLIKNCEKTAKQEYRIMRALTLPRASAAVFLEMAIVLDRAAVLEEAGFNVATCRIWPDDISARNLCIVAWR